MKVRLLHRERDFDPQTPQPWQAEALIKDLELTKLFEAMAQGDKFLHEVARSVILTGCGKNPATIRYRQEILGDCLRQPGVVREFYALAVESTELAKTQYLGFLPRHPDTALWRSIEHMKKFLGVIKKLRKLADAQTDKFVSEGWSAFFTRLRQELADEYLEVIENNLDLLKFHNGVLLSAELGRGNKGHHYVLHRPLLLRKKDWLKRLLARRKRSFPWLQPFFEQQLPAFSFKVNPRDEAGGRALAELRNRGIGLAATALAQSRDQIHGFFRALLTELAFYLGCLNLHQRLAGKGDPLCLPSLTPSNEGRLTFHGLYDVCLSLSMSQRVVGNDANADRKALVMITGANQGGKSTFLRSIGQAQLMMQCGMFVPAGSYSASVCDGLFTHFKREEDASLESGKLDEELSRMSAIVDQLRPHSMVLLNESFAATNEREGAEIARQVISALKERGIRVICVTHLYELARGFHVGDRADILFLRAERQEDGTRTFKLIEGEPLPTSFGEDLYQGVFSAKNIGEDTWRCRPIRSSNGPERPLR